MKLMTDTVVCSHLEIIVPPTQFVSELATMVKQRPILESDQSLGQEDVILQGILQLLQRTLRKRTDIRSQFPNKEEMLLFLLHDCLFHKETNRSLLSHDSS